LPQVLGAASQARVFKENLAALGFEAFPGINPVIGPFNSFDARLQLAWPLLDPRAIQKSRSSQRKPEIALEQERLAREQVAAAAAIAYLDAQRTAESVRTSQVSVELAKTLLKQAEDLKKAGTAAKIDVARAQTRLAQESLRALVAKSSSQDA